jgi:hypothetical protein
MCLARWVRSTFLAKKWHEWTAKEKVKTLVLMHYIIIIVVE